MSDEDTDCGPTRQQLVENSDAVPASPDDPVASCCEDYVGRCLGNTDPALDFDCENLGGIAAADAQGKPGADFAACLATGGEFIFIMPHVCLFGMENHKRHTQGLMQVTLPPVARPAVRCRNAAATPTYSSTSTAPPATTRTVTARSGSQCSWRATRTSAAHALRRPS